MRAQVQQFCIFEKLSTNYHSQIKYESTYRHASHRRASLLPRAPAIVHPWWQMKSTMPSSSSQPLLGVVHEQKPILECKKSTPNHMKVCNNAPSPCWLAALQCFVAVQVLLAGILVANYIRPKKLQRRTQIRIRQCYTNGFRW